MERLQKLPVNARTKHEIEVNVFVIFADEIRFRGRNQCIPKHVTFCVPDIFPAQRLEHFQALAQQIIIIGLNHKLSDFPPVTFRVDQLFTRGIRIFRRQTEALSGIDLIRKSRGVGEPQRILAREPQLVRSDRSLTRFRLNPAGCRRVYVNVDVHHFCVVVV